MDPRVTAVVRIIDSRLDRRLDPADLAAAVNLSTSRLRHLFRDEMHLSVTQYVMARRLERARELSENTFLTVKQIAMLSGFGDLSHFVRAFEAHHGLSPRRYREWLQSRGSIPQAKVASR